MTVQPTVEVFRSGFDAGRPQVVWTTVVADLDNPLMALSKLAKDEPYSFLLESGEKHEDHGRYSIIGIRPDVIWRCVGNNAEINRDALTDRNTFAPCPVSESEGALASLRALELESRIDLPEDIPPMAAGLVGYLGYDTVRFAEPTVPDTNPDTIGIPDGVFVRPTIVAVFDNLRHVVTLTTPVRPAGQAADAAYADAAERLHRVVESLARPCTLPPWAGDMPVDEAKPVANMTPDDYKAMVGRAKDYIKAGDIFQVVLSQRFRMPFTRSALAFYRALRHINPSPYMFYLDLDGFTIVGSSPEILVRVRDGKVTIRPIAGTRKRGADKAEDDALAAELLADEKETAEHLMLLDLGRNDVGRVAEIGTVDVTAQFTVERYSHVMHIVSNVDGILDPKHDAMDALMAGLPAGTVSGAPKVRAMEIIDELEPERRSFYAGGIGYISAGGSMDTAIALRTALIKDNELIAQAGAGIVADSDPDSEHQECVNKAMALIRAAEQAVKFTPNRKGL